MIPATSGAGPLEAAPDLAEILFLAWFLNVFAINTIPRNSLIPIVGLRQIWQESSIRCNGKGKSELTLFYVTH